MGMDSAFCHAMCGCAKRCRVNGVIVLDGDKSKLKARISLLLDDSGNS